MIYILPVSARKRKNQIGKGIGWYHEEGPELKIFNIQRPFAHLSVGPMINTESDLKEYRKWVFKRLLVSTAVKQEFTDMLDVLIQEGEIVLQCSCIPPRPCHGSVIKDALTWAEKLGVEGWHPELKKIAAGNFAKRG